MSEFQFLSGFIVMYLHFFCIVSVHYTSKAPFSLNGALFHCVDISQLLQFNSCFSYFYFVHRLVPFSTQIDLYPYLQSKRTCFHSFYHEVLSLIRLFWLTLPYKKLTSCSWSLKNVCMFFCFFFLFDKLKGLCFCLFFYHFGVVITV